MNCSEFEAMLDERLDGRGAPLPFEATAHRQTCSSCARVWQGACLVDAAVRAGRFVEPPASLTARVMSSLSEFETSSRLTPARLESRTQSHAGRWAVAAVVACLVLVCVIAGRNGDVGRGGQLARTPNMLTDGAGLFAGSPPTEVSESVVALLADLKAEYRGLANETTATAQDFVAVLPQPVAWPNASSSEPEEDSLASPPVSEIGRSIGDQIGQAIGFLWQTVPGEAPAG